MVFESFREAVRLLRQIPVLWVSGAVGGLLLALIWLLYHFTGAFFAGRLIILFGLLLLVFIVGMLVVLRERQGDLRALISGGFRYYFRVLLPFLVIIFTVAVAFMLLIVTLGFAGITPDPQTLSIIFLCVIVPVLMLTYFFDLAAVLEDQKVFSAIQRSASLVSANLMEVIAFFIMTALAGFAVIFGLMMVWEIALITQLEPLMNYTEAQMAALTPGDLLAMIGQEGIWVTAAVLFIGGLILIPLLFTYKACYFRKLAGHTPPEQEITGEYDSKGRWYKY
jgi:hypothetical protein